MPMIPSIAANNVQQGSQASIEWICIACGTQYPSSVEHPPTCSICEDSRQFVGWSGQNWTTLDFLTATHKNTFSEQEAGLLAIHTEPEFAIGQRAFVLKTPEGNILWDCVALLDRSTESEIQRIGGIAAIAISHPHYYTTMVEWSRAFGGVPIYLHELDRNWVVRPDKTIQFWQGDSKRILGGATLIRTGGHFDGFQVLHWPAPDGAGVLLAGDQPEVCMDRNWVTFMYSYPNLIPLGTTAIRGIVKALAPLSFERLHAAFPARTITKAAKQIVVRSAERYLRAIAG